MFAKTIIDSDAFLEMPLTSQLLYFHLSMRADDEGFINKPKSIMRLVGCKDDDILALINKGFLIPFESGVVVIKHWKMHNYIRGDRLQSTEYIEERSQLYIKDNNAYTLTPQSVRQLTDSCLTNDSVGKDSIDKGNKKASPKKVFEHDSKPYKCAEYLAEKIKSRVPNKVVTEDTLQSWALDIDLLNRIDKQEWKDIAAVLDFSQQDGFWSKNILSGKNLRKNFDRLYLKMQEAL